jgi:hypothetical protein
VLLNQLPLPDPAESLITSFLFIHRVHPITPSCSSGHAVGVTRIASVSILSVSALFQWLEDRHSTLQTISFRDDIDLVVECDELGEGIRDLERIAKDTVQWGSDNKVKFEVSKTGVLLFSRRRKVLRAATDVVVRIGEQSFAMKQVVTKWLGFWLDPKLSFEIHFENRMASAKGALQRVASLSRNSGG